MPNVCDLLTVFSSIGWWWGSAVFTWYWLPFLLQLLAISILAFGCERFCNTGFSAEKCARLVNPFTICCLSNSNNWHIVSPLGSLHARGLACAIAPTFWPSPSDLVVWFSSSYPACVSAAYNGNFVLCGITWGEGGRPLGRFGYLFTVYPCSVEKSSCSTLSDATLDSVSVEVTSCPTVPSRFTKYLRFQFPCSSSAHVWGSLRGELLYMCLKAREPFGTGSSLMLNLFTSRDRMLCSYNYNSLSQGSTLRRRLTLLMMARIPMLLFSFCSLWYWCIFCFHHEDISIAGDPIAGRGAVVYPLRVWRSLQRQYPRAFLPSSLHASITP